MVFRWANFATQKRSGEAIMLQRDMTEKTSTTQLPSQLFSSFFFLLALLFVLCSLCCCFDAKFFLFCIRNIIISEGLNRSAFCTTNSLFLFLVCLVFVCVSYVTCIAVLHVYVCFAYDLCFSQEKNQNVHTMDLGRNYLLHLVDVHNLTSPGLQPKTLFSELE